MASDKGRTALISSLESYRSSYPEELVFRNRFLELLRDFQNCFERSLLHAHITGSAWILDRTGCFALMTHHAKLDKWLQLGGHADGESDILNTALREAQEESGLSSVQVLDSEIFDLDIHVIPERKNEPAHEHFDIRYLFTADRGESIDSNHESKEISWIAIDKLDEMTHGNRSILRMAEKSIPIKGKVSSVW